MRIFLISFIIMKSHGIIVTDEYKLSTNQQHGSIVRIIVKIKMDDYAILMSLMRLFMF